METQICLTPKLPSVTAFLEKIWGKCKYALMLAWVLSKRGLLGGLDLSRLARGLPSLLPPQAELMIPSGVFLGCPCIPWLSLTNFHLRHCFLCLSSVLLCSVCPWGLNLAPLVLYLSPGIKQIDEPRTFVEPLHGDQTHWAEGQKAKFRLKVSRWCPYGYSRGKGLPGRLGSYIDCTDQSSKPQKEALGRTRVDLLGN